LELKKKDNSEVVVFHSIVHKLTDLEPILGNEPGMTLSYQIHQNKIDIANKLLNNVKDLFKKSNASIETRLINYKEPHEYIKEQVKKEGFDLVILGCKGVHSRVQKVIGTVPEKVLNETQCDVLIVR
jgi:nucleotide-binding universal stress UspA family protein